jgi:predicted phosphodiesterase
MGSAKHRHQPSRHLPGRGQGPATDQQLQKDDRPFNVRLLQAQHTERSALASQKEERKAQLGEADLKRIERNAFRRQARAENAAELYTRELTAVIQEQGFTRKLHFTPIPEGGDAVLVVQLSDLHFNEVVDLPSNRYDFTVASQRLAKLAQRIKQLGKSYGANKVVVACLGDFLNSDRRADEALSNATNRSVASFIAAQILQAFLLDLRQEFAVDLYAIAGNESRVNQELGWSDAVATDSYDLKLYGMLWLMLKDCAGFKFCGFHANELLFEVMGHTFLCLHGHQIRGDIQKQVQQIAGKYANQGVIVDFTMFGHIHASYIGDFHARNASLVGSNAYSESALGYSSKAAQNVHIVTGRKTNPTGAVGTIDGMKVDLQDTSGITPYPFNANEPLTPSTTNTVHPTSIVHKVAA